MKRGSFAPGRAFRTFSGTFHPPTKPPANALSAPLSATAPPPHGILLILTQYPPEIPKNPSLSLLFLQLCCAIVVGLQKNKKENFLEEI